MEPRPTPTAARVGLGLVVALGVFLLALLFGAWGVWQVARGGRPPACDPRATAVLEQRIATLGRSDQISRDANRQL